MAKRASLQTFAPKINPQASKGIIEAKLAGEGVTPPKYPKVSVYLTAAEVKQLRTLYVETGRKVSDICAVAVREWLAKNGHARSETFKA